MFLFLLQNRIELKNKVNIGLLGFNKDFTIKELQNLLENHLSSALPRIRNGMEYQDSKVWFGIDYNVGILISFQRQVVHIRGGLLQRYQTVLNETMSTKIISLLIRGTSIFKEGRCDDHSQSLFELCHQYRFSRTPRYY